MVRAATCRAVCGVLLGVALAAQVSAQSPLSARLDELVPALMRERNIAGVALAVVQDGREVVSRAWGEAKRPGEPARPETVFFLDSMTKQFTSAAIMLLVQDGRIDLEAPVRHYPPDAPASWNLIHIRHLLTHTAGLAHDARPYAAIPEQNCDTQAIVRPLFHLSPQWAPGSKYAYSNAGYNTLAAVIERVTGGCWFHFLRDRIFGPIGMQRTQLALYETQREPGHARGYRATPAGIREQEPVAHALGGGGIASTVEDLARWDAALRGDAILSAASKRAMWTPFTLTSGRQSAYGFGWEINHTPAGLLVHHNGGGFGFNTAIYRYVDAGLTVIVLTNTVAAPDARPRNNGDVIAHRVAALLDSRLGPR